MRTHGSYNDTAEREFVASYLGPTLRREHPSVKIMGFDHNKVGMYARTPVAFMSHVGHAIYVSQAHCILHVCRMYVHVFCLHAARMQY